jgi:steroid 5-alpha reductase family enzyme
VNRIVAIRDDCVSCVVTGLWPSDIIGGVVWGIGFFCEATADWQKLRFKLDPANKGRYIKTGVYFVQLKFFTFFADIDSFFNEKPLKKPRCY